MTRSNSMSDEAWLSQVFRENEIPLMGYATHLMGDADRASDVVQDTFVRLCRQDRRQVQDRVRKWLYTVCRNRALDILQKEKRMKTLDDAQAGRQKSRDDDPQLRAQRQETAAQAGSLIDDLPDHQREVIRLKVHSGLSYREISELTGLSVSNVGYLLHTGLKSIRARLATIE
ncbi:MAG: RNA polymerase sigma factor [Pirellulales bacterium]|nr:RNA polymerase sigma factor [Pirellulales bacterium]